MVIGGGKGGKTLAMHLARQNHKTALIERDPLMIGGGCINVACIPTKTFIASARFSGQIFNVGSSHMNCTIGDIGRLLAKHYPQLEVTEAANGDGRDYRVDFSRIEALGFRCEVTLDEGVREISAYVRERRPDLSESRYHNGQTTKEKLQALLFDSQMGSPSPSQESVRSQRICDLE